MSDNKPVHGTFCWNELMSRDVKAAGKFYSDLIGWKLDSQSMGRDYTVLKAGETQAGGMMAMPAEVPDQVPSHWMAYITVDEVDAVAARVPELGGTVLNGPTDVPKVGRFIVVQDPTGAAVGMITLAPPEK